MGESDKISLSPQEASASSPLCLSLCWDPCCNNSEPGNRNDNLQQPKRIVSTYSNGCVALHEIVYLEKSDSVQFVEISAWRAHTMFGCPSEVWSACFANTTGSNNSSKFSDTVFSGGDEGIVKIWDTRSTDRPTQIIKDVFEAGVTVLSPNPKNSSIVAAGSYDETICLFDLRKTIVRQGAKKHVLSHCKPLGGGIWRIKWHPHQNKILCAAMHGGCRVIEIDGLETCTATLDDNKNNSYEENTTIMNVVEEFIDHESMAYGADWLVCQYPNQEKYFEAAVSCSFYDQAVHLWDAKGVATSDRS